MCDEYQCDLVVTTGGTGLALRDITPEATEKVCQKMLPVFGELTRMTSLNMCLQRFYRARALALGIRV